MGSAKKEQFKGIFVYTDEILRDFEAMYRMKTSVSPVTKLVMGLTGAAGTLVFLVLMLLQGFSVSFLFLMAAFALLLLLALFGGRRKVASSAERYRKHYLGKKVHVLLDDNGVELKLNGQKSFARSKFKDVYSLIETEKTLFLEIKGRAFYILPKDGMDCVTEELKAFIQKKCGKRFVQYDVGQ